MTVDPAPAERPTAYAAALDAAKVWADTLIDKTGRNELLYCKNRGKILLESADSGAVYRLLCGETVRLRQLFRDEPTFQAVARTAESIRRRIKEYDEERGVRIGRLTFGFAGWQPPLSTRERDVRAPVVLRDIAISHRPGRDDFDIRADRDAEISPVLLHYLRSTFRLDIDPDLIADLNDVVDDPERIDEALEKLTGVLSEAPDFRIAPGALIGTFHYAKLAMHQDLLDNAEVFAANDLVGALAGDLGAIERIRRPIGQVTIDQPDRTPPADEFLVLDADPSQNYVINAALAGRNLVVQGPPGTGKSQTISNLIATFAAHGRSVLFVAEKRAAIDAVLGRLTEAGLHDLTLDLHVTTANRSKAYEQFRLAIDAARTVEAIDPARLHARLERTRASLIDHDRAMHTVRQPWGMSVDDLQSALLGTPDEARSDIRLSAGATDALDGDGADRVRVALAELISLGGLAPAQARGPWAAAQFQSDAAATRAREAVAQLLGWLPELRVRSAEVAKTLGFADPATPAEAGAMLRICLRTAAVAARWRPEIYEQDLPRLIAAATGTSTDIGWWARHRLCREAKRLRLRGVHGDLAADLREVASVAAEWWRISRVRPPVQPDLAAAASANGTAQALLVEMGGLLAAGDLAARDWASLAAMLDELAKFPNGAHTAARINRVGAQLREAGLGDLLDWLARVAPTWPDERRVSIAIDAFGALWHRAVLDRVLYADPHLASFDGTAHSATADDFIATDHAHIAANRQRVRRSVAERLTDVRSAHLEQDVYLGRELTRKRRLKPLRELVRDAPEVLLAAKPCWAMSPLLVSQLLPPGQLFDVVIFDEASQVQPAEAMPSIARARTVVIAGDSRQLPPTAFFEAAVDTDDGVDRDLLTQDAESVLESFNRALGHSLANEFYLGWHYRSRDARLIAPSNAFFYDNRMMTFPGTAVAAPVRFVEVPAAESADGTSAAEVRRVVELAVEHARTRPNESLGVITMGITHANRVEDALYQRLRGERALRDWFDAEGAEPFFVKNLERVQGDERDAIILAIGYGKSKGRMMYRFGPLNNAGGERRLNVAITRAKRRMTVVAGFRPDELDPSRLNSDGARRLADYLRYAADGSIGGRPLAGAATGAAAPTDAGLTPFQSEVRRRLRAVGIDVQCHVGVAGYFLDAAAMHPTTPGRMVLAIEGDGATYHNAPTTRSRDRLRQEQLERLGWRFHRVWSTDWTRNPDREVAKIRAAYEEAVYAADRADAPPMVVDDPAPAATDERGTHTGDSYDNDEFSDDGFGDDGFSDDAGPRGRAAALAGSPRGPRPPASFGAPIGDYSDAELIGIIEWIMSDGLLRTDFELKQEARDELGFRRNGSRIDRRLSAAIDAARVRRAGAGG